jgi:hypothetical protein
MRSRERCPSTLAIDLPYPCRLLFTPLSRAVTPKIRCSGKSVDPALIFSIDSKLFRDDPQQIEGLGKPKGDDDDGTTQHHDEVET